MNSCEDLDYFRVQGLDLEGFIVNTRTILGVFPLVLGNIWWVWVGTYGL